MAAPTSRSRALLTLAVSLLTVVPSRAEKPSVVPLAAILADRLPPPDPGASEPSGDPAAREDSPRLADLESRMSALALALESFRDASQADAALMASAQRFDPALRPFLKDRATALDAAYRTLAVADYTWALRSPEPPCSPREARRKLLRSSDGLFVDSATGESSPWLVRLLGAAAAGRSAEAALDGAGAERALDARAYALLRAQVRRLTVTLESAANETRAALYCERAGTYRRLAAAQRTADGPTLASRSASGGESEAALLLARREGEDYSILGGAALVSGPSGPRLVTDAGLVTEPGDLVAFSRGLKNPRRVVIDSKDDSGLAIGHLDADEGVVVSTLADRDPGADDLVTAVAQSGITGFWSQSEGLVTASNPGAFRTDAVPSSEMRGALVFNAAGGLAGISVLGASDERPIVVASSRLRAILAGNPEPWSLVAAALPSDGAGTSALVSAAAPFGAPGAGAIEAGSWSNEHGNHATWCDSSGCMGVSCLKSCVGSSGSNSGSARSSYSGNNQMGAELGQALGNLVVMGIDSFIRWLATPSKPRDAHPRSAAPSSAPAVVAAPPPPPPPKKEPLRPISLDLSLSRHQAAPGESVTLTATIGFTGEEGTKAGIPVRFSIPSERANCSPCSRSTDASGVASVTVTILATKDDAPRKVEARSNSAHDDLDRESAAHSEEARDVEDSGPVPQEQPTDAAAAIPMGTLAPGAQGNMPPSASPRNVDSSPIGNQEMQGARAFVQSIIVSAGAGSLPSRQRDLMVLITDCPPDSIVANAYGQGAVPAPGHLGMPPSKAEMDFYRHCEQMEAEAKSRCGERDTTCRAQTLRSHGYDFERCPVRSLPPINGATGGQPATVGGMRPFRYVKCVRPDNLPNYAKAQSNPGSNRGWYSRKSGLVDGDSGGGSRNPTIRPGSLEDLLRGAEIEKDTYSRIYRKSGGLETANREFDDFTNGVPIKDQGNGVRSATMADGSSISVRSYSSPGIEGPGSRPTIQIDPAGGGPKVKIRYGP